ncbi:MAG: aminoglycoside phosphotransferase family protein [Euzebya sp.]
MSNSQPGIPADVVIDLDLVGRLLTSQHPDLAGRTRRVMATGWDHVMVVLGDDLVARLPRRELGAGMIQGEQRFLRQVGPELALPVPVPLRLGVPGAGYPYHWSVVPWLEGDPAGDETDMDQAAAAQDLGRFLATLHRPAAADAPHNPYRGVPLHTKTADVERRLTQLGPDIEAATLERVFSMAVDASPWPGPPLWVHGDLHPRNVLIARRRISAVLDFSDVHGGDPAIDAIIAWMLLPTQQHRAFRHAAPSMDDTTWTRGKGWAVHLGLTVLLHGQDSGDHAFTMIGRRALCALMESAR